MIPEPPLDAPDEDWLVWADAMQQIGDLRGELVALAALPAKRDAFVKKHATALLGNVVGRHVAKGTYRVTRWRHYRPDEIEVRISDATKGPSLVVDLIRSPHAAYLRGLAIAGVPRRDERLDLRATLGWLRESALPRSLRSLALVDDHARSLEHLVSGDFEPPENRVAFGPLAELWPAFAQIEELRMVVADPGQIQFQVIRLPALRSFTLEAKCWAGGLGAMLANSRWPQLTSLELTLCDMFIINERADAGRVVGSHRPIDWSGELTPIFEALRGGPLERLALRSFFDVAPVLDAIDVAELPALVELDLSDSAIDREHAGRLANSPLVSQIRRLVLERVRLPSSRGFEGVPEVVHSTTHTAPAHRYFVTME